MLNTEYAKWIKNELEWFKAGLKHKDRPRNERLKTTASFFAEFQRIIKLNEEWEANFVPTFKKGVSFDLGRGTKEDLLKVDLMSAINVPKFDYARVASHIDSLNVSRAQEANKGSFFSVMRYGLGDSDSWKDDEEEQEENLTLLAKAASFAVALAQSENEKVPTEFLKLSKALTKAKKGIVEEKKKAEDREFLAESEYEVIKKFRNIDRIYDDSDLKKQYRPCMKPEDIDGEKAGKPMTHEEANGNQANPKIKSSNGLYKVGEVNGYANYLKASYEENCATCAIAYEMRRRGFDVSAKPYISSHEGLNSSEIFKKTPTCVTNVISRYYLFPWIDPETNTHPVPKLYMGQPKVEQAIKWLKEEMVDNARYELRVSWKNKRYGHAVNAFLKDGEPCIYDPQTGTLYEGALLTRFVEHVKFPAVSSLRKASSANSRMHLTRIDNLLVDENIVRRILISNKNL